MANSIYNFDESFPHLSHAPIVEAIIDIQVAPHVNWDEAALRNEIASRLSTYTKIETIRETMYQVFIEPNNEPKQKCEDFGTVGLKAHSTDSFYIAQFRKNGFTLSRLKQYETWETFQSETLRLWDTYCGLFKPSTIQRIGVRFINCIELQQHTCELSHYYKIAPEPLPAFNWPQVGFLYQDQIHIPDTSYFVNLIKTIRNAPNAINKGIGLILDIDVYMQNPFLRNDDNLIGYLKQMRWVKNKIFFNSITDKTLEMLR